MKTNKLIKFAASLMLCCIFFGCTPEEEKLGTIYGTVTDFSTGEPINNANVRLNPRGETTLTGSDGSFQFNDLATGSYSLSLSKNGYANLDDDYVIKMESGYSVSRDVQMQKELYSLKIVDNDGNTVSELDFGIDDGVNQKAFSIFNDGNMSLDFTIAKTSNWIKEIVPPTGKVSIGEAKPVSVIINRELLQGGVNRSNLLITTSGTGGVELAVQATKYSAPVVTTGIVTNITHKSAACSGSITSDGGSSVTERGVCWSTAPNPTINDFKTTSGSGLGSYSCNMTNLSNNTKYYVKAYAKNYQGVAYGEEKSFTTEKFPTFQYGGYTYYVAPDPGNDMQWSVANSYCNNLSLGGMSGWRMPTRDELVQMYADRNSIGGFNHYKHYWSSTSGSSGHYGVYFQNGSVYDAPNSATYLVRPIKKKTTKQY